MSIPIVLQIEVEEPIILGASQTGGTVLSVNGKKGVVVLTAEDVGAIGQEAIDGKVDKVTGKGLSENDFTDAYKLKVDNSVSDANYVHTDNNYTTTEKNKLASITEIFTTALKNAYDGAVSWISTNGSNILNHIGITSGNPHGTSYSDVGAEPANSNIQSHIINTSNPHSVTYSQVGADPSGSYALGRFLITEEITVTSSGATYTISPNRATELNTNYLTAGTHTFNFSAPQSGMTNDYYIEFQTGATAPTIVWGVTIDWGSSTPTFEANKRYEVIVRAKRVKVSNTYTWVYDGSFDVHTKI